MVMHARKLPRINDGYHDRHQQSHPSYQNSKYSSSKGGSYAERCNQERSERLRNSPNGNASRSNTPDRDHSPRNRAYGNKTWYQQKLHEKDRAHRFEPGRERTNNKEKYPLDYSRSPKDRRHVNKELGYPTNHDRSINEKPNSSGKGCGQNYTASKDSQRKTTHNNIREKRDDRERTLKVGDWSEHTSSSGKKYYYNCKTEVSQWEKPKEWLEKEGLTHLLRHSASSSSSRIVQDKHSIARSNPPVNNYRDHQKYSQSREAGSCSGWNNRDNLCAYKDDHHPDHKIQESSSNAPVAVIGESQTQDMEISSENSTPTSEHFAPSRTPQQHNLLMDVHIPQSSSSGPGPPIISSCSSIPKLTPNVSRSEIISEMSSSFNSSSLTTVVTASTSLNNDKMKENNVIISQSKIDPNSICDTGGPPTPTHSETQDDLEQKSGSSPETAATAPGVSALQGIQLQSFYPMQLPQLTPGLSQFVNDDLTEHIRGWPAETCEKQAHKLATEAHLITSMRITDISIALKSARSRVRLNEIQSTLLEQRVMLYRHEVKSLENMKTPSLFTADDN